ncbi:MAG TPA: glycosyltransferase [Blastocatellia bacterium]|nr:glycosyltransferase [Blastocatellia bacterium]
MKECQMNHQAQTIAAQTQSAYQPRPDRLSGFAWLFALIKKALLIIYLYSGYVQLRDAMLSLFGRSRVVVLCYHRIGGKDVLSKPVEDFQRDLAYLKRHYECLSLAELCARLRDRKPFRRRAAVITFDDGYRDNYTAAVPALRDAGIGATFFVSTGFIGTKRDFPHDEGAAQSNHRGDVAQAHQHPKLTWDDLREMEAAGFEIGSHTVNHTDLGTADKKTIQQEINESLAALNRELGMRPRAFAFPWGKPENISVQAINVARQAGCYAAASAYGGLNRRGTDLYNIHRTDAGNGELNWLALRARIAGFDPDYIRLKLKRWQQRLILVKETSDVSRPLNVMQVTWSLVAGGAEVYALTIASGLNKQKYRGMMCAIDQGGALENEMRQGGIPYFLMHRRPGIQFSLLWRMYRLFRTHQSDVVQTHGFNQILYSALGAKLAGARLIHTEHSTELYKHWRRRIALRLLSMLSDKVIAIGKDSANFLREQVRIPAHKIEIIRAGIDPQAFVESQAEARCELSLNRDDRIAVIVARLYPEKNYRLLLAAFAKAVQQIERAKLLIVGEGIEQEAIHHEIQRLGLSDQVQMLGVRRDVARILAAADVFVLSSDREGLPIAIIEALAAARPVIATAVGDIPEVISDGVTGRIVPPRNSEALTAALVELLGDSALATSMGLSARQSVVERYTTDAMLSQYDQIFAIASAKLGKKTIAEVGGQR